MDQQPKSKEYSASPDAKNPARHAAKRGIVVKPYSLSPTSFLWHEAFEPSVDIAVVNRIVALDDAGLVDCKPSHHQVSDVRLCFLAGREAQRVAAPLA